MFLTILSLFIGYLTLSVSIALLYSVGASTPEFSSAGQGAIAQFVAFAAICSLGFATLSGYLTAIVAKRAPIFHAGLLAVLLTVIWGISTFFGPTAQPLSVAILNLATGVAGVMAGGWWRLRQMRANAEG